MMTDSINKTLAEYAGKYPGMITFKQAAEIAHRAMATIYDWSSRDLFSDFKVKRGRGGLLERDGFIRFLYCGHEPSPENN